jgi:tetratricopeptide (TPR) repeat protein
VKGEEQLWRILNDKLEMLGAAGRLEEAQRVAESALSLARRAFSSDHPSLALSYERLGLICDREDRTTEAAGYLTKALDIVERIEPRDQRAIYRLARRLASLSEGGDEQVTIGFYEKAIEAGTALGNVPHSELGALLNNLALTCRRSGRSENAEQYYLQALEIYEKQLGTRHADVAAVLNNLGVYYTNEGRYREAEQAHTRALTIRQNARPPSLSEIAQSQCNLAVLYHSRGDFERADELYRQSLQSWESTGQPSPDYEIAVANYADLLRSLGKKRKAAGLESRARKRQAG